LISSVQQNIEKLANAPDSRIASTNASLREIVREGSVSVATVGPRDYVSQAARFDFAIGETVELRYANNDIRAGSKGEVVEVSDAGVKVIFCNGTWTFQPSALVKAASLHKAPVAPIASHMTAESSRIRELELEVEKLSRSFQEINVALQRQAREIAIETFSSQIATVRQQVMQEAQLVVKQQASDFLYETLSKPSSSAQLHQAIVSSPQLSQHIQTVVEDRIRHSANIIVRQEVQQLGNEVVDDLRKIAADINAESELRARADGELNRTLRFEIASVRSHIEATRLHLEDVDAMARQTTIEEIAELRSILDSVWSKVATRSKDTEDANYYFKFIDPKGGCDETAQYKECVGDAEDINTLYEMVREALGTSIVMRKELDEEKRRRDLEKHRVDRLQQDTMQLDKHYQMLQGVVRGLSANS